MLLQRAEQLELDVRQGTDRERDLLIHEPLDQLLVLQASDAMVDPLDFQQVERLPYVLCGPFLAGMRHRQPAFLPGPVEDGLELFGWMSDLRRVEANRRDPILERERLLQSGHGVIGAEMPQKAEDQP